MAEKMPIGKILLQKQKISQDDLGQALERQQREGGRLASNLLAMGLAGEEDLLVALGEQLGVPAVDLARTIIPLHFLDVIPEKVASDACIMPLKTEEDRVLLAMANPMDQQVIDEISFVTGKKIEPYVVIEVRLRQVVREAYALRKRDASIAFYRGERAEIPDGGPPPEGYLAIVSEQLPEPDVVITPDEELISIEVSTSDEILEQMANQETTGDKDGDLILVIVRMLEKALTAEGFQVATASRGLQALQAVKAHPPALVLLDAMLPEIHGFEICKKIKSSRRFGHIPVIMISAVYRGWRYALDAKEAYGADDYFEKPFRLVPLVRRVRELLSDGNASAVETHEDQDAANEAYQKGVALYREKSYDSAEAALREACQLDPFSANVHYALANVLLARNLVYEAMREYEYTVELKPDLFAPLRNLAILYQKKGFRNKAVEMWERALRCSPEGEKEQVRAQLLKLL